MQYLKFEDLLRYGLSGGLFLVTLLLVHPPSGDRLPQPGDFGDATMLAALALLLGSLIYTFHRAVIYPLLFQVAWLILVAFHVYKFEDTMLIPYRQPKVERELDECRWNLHRQGHVLYGVIAEWGAQVHFLYCSAWAILLALLFNRFLPHPQIPLNAQLYPIDQKILFGLSLVILAGGLCSELRLLARIAHACTRNGSMFALTKFLARP